MINYSIATFIEDIVFPVFVIHSDNVEEIDGILHPISDATA